MSKQKRHTAVVFKPYVQNQGWLFPPTLGEMIPIHHKVRLINDAIEGMDLDPILSTYEGGGRSSYHPKMLLKVLVYGYTEKIYSSRKLEKALKENICFMWLSGLQQPDHNTINTFRRHRLNNTVKEVFAQVLLLLIEQGYVKLEDYYVDGTIMESVANRYTFVWAKNVQRYKASLLNKIADLITYIEQTNEKESVSSTSPDSTQILNSDQPKLSDSEALKQTINRLNESLESSTESDKALKKKQTKLKHLQDKHLPKLEEYEKQESILNGRSSYSKTDPDATFMRTKEDHLGNGQLKACYNIQLGTENQFIINYTLHQTPSDKVVFTTHMDNTLDLLQSIDAPKPKNAVTDGGYGSEENYEYLEAEGIQAYVKYPGFYRQQQGNKFKHPFDQRTLYYNEKKDIWTCPMGQPMVHIGSKEKKTSSGKIQTIDLYSTRNCNKCPLKGACTKAKGDRILEVNHKARQYREQARKRLNSLKGIRKRKQRNTDVEPVFGHIKQCRGFRRFLLTTLDGVSTETGLLSIAHNFTKWHLQKEAIRIGMPKSKIAKANALPIPQKQQNSLQKAG